MTGTEPEPRSPRPLADELPAVYAEDPVARVVATALDTIIGPMIGTLDNLDAYLQPKLAPEHFLDWLAQWVGAELVGDEPLALRREAVTDAVTMHRRRGTAAGLTSAVRLATGEVPEIVESGGSTWSARPLGPFPGTPRPGLRVRLRVADPGRLNRARLDAVVAAAVPAHLPFAIDVIGTDGNGPDTG